MTPARDLTARLRAAGLQADRAFDGRSPKAQFKAADRSGARLALVVGPDEAAGGKVGIKDLVAGGEQVDRRRREPRRRGAGSARRGPGPPLTAGGPPPRAPPARRQSPATPAATPARHPPPSTPQPPVPPPAPGSLPPMPAGANDDLFAAALNERLAAQAPLAARMRPQTLDEVVGQDHLLGTGPAAAGPHRVRPAVVGDPVGPPGTGKTTLARLIAGATRKAFVPMSAVTAGVKDVRDTVAGARRLLAEQDRGTIFFLDEVHRFNRAQQDALLPSVEDGTLVLVGATTENPVLLGQRPPAQPLDPLSAGSPRRRRPDQVVQPGPGPGGRRPPTTTPWRCSSAWSTATPGPP